MLKYKFLNLINNGKKKSLFRNTDEIHHIIQRYFSIYTLHIYKLYM